MVTTTSTAQVFGTAEGSLYGVGGLAADSQIAEVPANLEVVVAAGSWVGMGPLNLQVLAKGINSNRERLDRNVIEAMLEDDAIGPALETLKLVALSGELGFQPSVDPGSEEATSLGIDPEEAKRARDFCEAAHDRLPVPLPIWGMDAMNCMAYGHKLAELVFEYIPVDETTGYWTLGGLSMKPLWSYHLVADVFMHPRAAYCQTSVGPAYVDIDHFVLFSWDVKDGDPRGSSIFRASKDAWRRKLRAKDSRSKGDDQFGTPSVVMELPPNAPIESIDPDTKQQAPTTVVARKELMKFQAGGAIVVPNGGKVYVLESQRDGIQISNSIDSYDRAATRGVLLQAKATMEAKHYTQGGGEIGQDLISTFGDFARDFFLAVVRRQVFWRLLAKNKGPAYADAHTPRLTLRQKLDEKFMAIANVLAVMGQAGLLAPSQIDDALEEVGLKRPRPGELRVGPSGPISDKLPDPATSKPSTAGGKS